MTWTRERTELLKRYWADGESASRIAFLLGGFEHCDDGGRNAVIGKVHRLKLACRETAVASRPPPPRKTADRVAWNKDKRTERTPRALSTPGEPRRPVEPVSLDIPITDLRPGQCKWPHGDGPFLFCGHTAEAGTVYCAFHKRVAYRPAERQAKPFVILGFRKVAA
jgi:GcrA cell cycle regulator